MNEDYPSFLTPESKSFDPIKLTLKTKEIVSKGNLRKYTDFYCVGVYGGISTGYTVGCSLRCIFCWVNWSRDFPHKAGKLFTPEQVFYSLTNNARRKGIKKLRISGGEPTLSDEHLISVLELISKTDFLFILETNGLLLGKDPELVNNLKQYKNIHIRVSLKAGTPEGFEKRTGGIGEFSELPFQAIKYLKREGISFHVAAMTDSRLMPRDERLEMLHKLEQIGYQDFLEEEHCDFYSSSVKRLEKAGFKLWK
ncbi:MAG: radical SAM protein [Candidatus Aminicenantaceae bacterium]